MDLQGLLSLVFSMPSGYKYFFCLLFCGGTLSPEKMDLMKMSHLGLSVCSKDSPSLYNVWLQISIFFPSATGRNFCDDGWERHWVMSIVESFYCYTFLKNSSICFWPRSLHYQVSGWFLVTQVIVLYGFPLIEQALNQIRYWLVTSTSFRPPLLYHSL